MIWQKKKSEKADKKIRELQENLAATDEAVNDVLMGDIAEQIEAVSVLEAAQRCLTLLRYPPEEGVPSPDKLSIGCVGQV